MKPREFHLFDLPERRIYVMLKDEFRKSIFKKAAEKFGSERKLAFYLSLSQQHLNSIIHARIPSHRTKKQSIPLWLLKNISSITETGVEEIEKNIVYIKGLVSSSPLYHPKLPLIESKELASLIGNLLGDGYAGKKRNPASYFNREKILVKLFRKKLIKVFGNVKVRYAENDNMICFPRFISEIIKHIYKVSFDTFDSRIPNIFYSSKELSASLITSFADDEAWVDDRRIEFYSANLNLINDLKKLMKLHFSCIKLNDIRTKKAKKGNRIDYSYGLCVLSDGLKYFQKEIGFNHSKKIKKLDFAINLQKLQNKRKGEGYTQNRILNFLQIPMTQEEISHKLQISSSTNREHLKILLNKDLIEPNGRNETNAVIWVRKW